MSDFGEGFRIYFYLMGCFRLYDFFRVRGDVFVFRDCRGLREKGSVRFSFSFLFVLIRTFGFFFYKVLFLVGRLMVREILFRQYWFRRERFVSFFLIFTREVSDLVMFLVETFSGGFRYSVDTVFIWVDSLGSFWGRKDWGGSFVYIGWYRNGESGRGGILIRERVLFWFSVEELEIIQRLFFKVSGEFEVTEMVFLFY